MQLQVILSFRLTAFRSYFLCEAQDLYLTAKNNNTLTRVFTFKHAVTKLLQGSSCGLYTVLVIQGKFVTGLYTDPHSHKAAGGYCGTPFQEQIQEPVFISHFQFFVFPPFLALLLTQCVPSFLTFLFPSMPSSSRPFSVPCLRLEQVQRVSGWWRELHLWQQILTWELVYCSRFL